MNHRAMRITNRMMDSAPPAKQNLGNTLKFFVTYQGKSIVSKDKRELAKWTKSQLLELGPTFIKMGQFVSTRSDIFDKEVIEELRTLQDRALPFPGETAKAIITEELGRPFHEVFKDFKEVDRKSVV